MALFKIPATLMRGGTSRGVFTRKSLVPEDSKDRFLTRLMGSPDPLQVDGLGGGFSSTSKVMLVDHKLDAGEIKYQFAQVYVEEEKVDYNGNCGNLTSAVGPFAVEDDIVKPPITDESKEFTTKLYNINTGKHIISRFSVVDGRPDYYSIHKDGMASQGLVVNYRHFLKTLS